MPKWVNIDKRAHTAAQRNLCESCGYGTQLPRAPKKPFSEGLLASSAIGRTSKRGGAKSRQFHCVGARFGSWHELHSISLGVRRKRWKRIDVILSYKRECPSWVKLLDSMLSCKNPCETASTPLCAKALSPPVEGIFEKIDSEWCTPIGLPFSEARRGCDVGYIYEGTRQQEKIQDSVCISWPEASQFSCFPCTDGPR